MVMMAGRRLLPPALGACARALGTAAPTQGTLVSVELVSDTM